MTEGEQRYTGYRGRTGSTANEIFAELQESVEDVSETELLDELDRASFPTPPDGGSETVSFAELVGEETKNDEQTADTATSERRTDDRTRTGSNSAPEPNQPSSSDGDELVSAFVTALDENTLDDEERKTVRRALGIDGPSSHAARLDYLQRRIDEVAAYADAWQAFLDERGTGRQFLREMESRLSRLEAHIEELDDATEQNRDVATTATEELRALRSEIETLDGELDDVSEWQNRLERALTAHERS